MFFINIMEEWIIQKKRLILPLTSNVIKYKSLLQIIPCPFEFIKIVGFF
jgi:hypothetical protein